MNLSVGSAVGTMIFIIILVLVIVSSCIKIVPQTQAFIIERLGAYQGTWSVGLHFKVPIIDRIATKVILKEQTLAVYGNILSELASVLSSKKKSASDTEEMLSLINNIELTYKK